MRAKLKNGLLDSWKREIFCKSLSQYSWIHLSALAVALMGLLSRQVIRVGVHSILKGSVRFSAPQRWYMGMSVRFFDTANSLHTFVTGVDRHA